MNIRVPIILATASFAAVASLTAHNRDMYNADRVLEIRLAEERVDLRIMLSLKEFPSLADRMEMDTDTDGWISEEEAHGYAMSKQAEELEALTLTADGRKLYFKPLGQKLDLYGKARVVPEHHDLILDTSSKLDLASEPGKTTEFRLKYSREWPYPGKVVFALIAARELAVDSTSLDGCSRNVGIDKLEDIKFYCRRRTEAQIEQAAGKGEGLWRIVRFAQAPSLPRFKVTGIERLAAGDDYIYQTTADTLDIKGEGRDKISGFTTRLQDYLEQGEKNIFRVWLLFVAAFIYGAFHALTPGHAKTLTAAYLVGSGHNWTHALILAATVTLTHTGSILALAVITRLAWGGALSVTSQAMLTGLSGLIVLVLGVQRLRGGMRGPGHFHDPPGHDHAHHPEIGEGHDYEGKGESSHHQNGGKRAAGKVKSSRARVLWLGFAGGLMPCPGALWIFFLTLGFGRPGLGVALIIALSAGLALVLLAVGLATIYLRSLLGSDEGGEGEKEPGKRGLMNKFTFLRSLSAAVIRILPTAAGTVLVLIGSFLLWKALSELGFI